MVSLEFSGTRFLFQRQQKPADSRSWPAGTRRSQGRGGVQLLGSARSSPRRRPFDFTLSPSPLSPVWSFSPGYLPSVFAALIIFGGVTTEVFMNPVMKSPNRPWPEV